MKRAALVLASVLVLGVVVLPALAGDAAKGKSHEATVEFVSFNAEAKTMTFKDDHGDSTTAPVLDAAAIKALGGVKAGDKVMITCADNDMGEHQGISKVKVIPVKHG